MQKNSSNRVITLSFMIRKITFDPSTFGITQKSLKALRNYLILNAEDKIVVVQVVTDEIVCGFFIINCSVNQAYYTGDGFRTDKGGEGGRGYAAALKLLNLFGLTLQFDYSGRMILTYTSEEEIRTQLLQKANEIYDNILIGTHIIDEATVILDTNPSY